MRPKSPSIAVIAARLRVLRAQRPEITQEIVADRLGVSQNAIGRWERGASAPRANQILQLCDLFAVSADYLIGRSEFPNGLSPDTYIVDLDAVDALRADPKKYGDVASKVPRRLQIMSHKEVEVLKRELGIE